MPKLWKQIVQSLEKEQGANTKSKIKDPFALATYIYKKETGHKPNLKKGK